MGIDTCACELVCVLLLFRHTLNNEVVCDASVLSTTIWLAQPQLLSLTCSIQPLLLRCGVLEDAQSSAASHCHSCLRMLSQVLHPTAINV